MNPGRSVTAIWVQTEAHRALRPFSGAFTFHSGAPVRLALLVCLLSSCAAVPPLPPPGRFKVEFPDGSNGLGLWACARITLDSMQCIDISRFIKALDEQRARDKAAE